MTVLGSGRSFPRPEIDATDETWLRTAITAAQCGHAGVLSTLLYYFSGWPWALYLQLTASHDRCSPGDRLGAYADCWTPPAVRKALSRFRANQANSKLCEWDIFHGHMKAIDSLPSVHLLLSPDPIIALPPKAGDAELVAGLATKQTHYLALRMAGLDPSLSLDESQLPHSFVGSLEKSLTAYISDVVRTWQLKPKQMLLVRKSLASGMGLDLLATVGRWGAASGWPRLSLPHLLRGGLHHQMRPTLSQRLLPRS